MPSHPGDTVVRCGGPGVSSSKPGGRAARARAVGLCRGADLGALFSAGDLARAERDRPIGVPIGVTVDVSVDRPRPSRRGPLRARLDAEHRPHRPVCRPVEGLVPRRRNRAQDPALRHAGARVPDGQRPGRLRHQLPGFAHVRGRVRRPDQERDGDPPARGIGDRGAGGLRDHPAARARRQDVRRFRLRQRGPDSQGRHQGGRRQGRLQGGPGRQHRLRGALHEEGGLHDPVPRLGGRRSSRTGHQAAHVRVHRLRLPRLLPGRHRLLRRLARQAPRCRPAFRGRDPARFRAGGERSRPGRGHPHRPEPGRVRREPEAAPRQREVPGRRRLPRRRLGARRTADPRRVDCLLRLPLRTEACSAAPTASRSPPHPTTGPLFTNEFLP